MIGKVGSNIGRKVVRGDVNGRLGEGVFVRL